MAQTRGQTNSVTLGTFGTCFAEWLIFLGRQVHIYPNRGQYTVARQEILSRGLQARPDRTEFEYCQAQYLRSGAAWEN